MHTQLNTSVACPRFGVANTRTHTDQRSQYTRSHWVQVDRGAPLPQTGSASLLGRSFAQACGAAWALPIKPRLGSTFRFEFRFEFPFGETEFETEFENKLPYQNACSEKPNEQPATPRTAVVANKAHCWRSQFLA